MNVITRVLNGWKSINLMTRILIGILIGSALALVCPGISWMPVFGTLFVSA